MLCDCYLILAVEKVEGKSSIEVDESSHFDNAVSAGWYIFSALFMHIGDDIHMYTVIIFWNTVSSCEYPLLQNNKIGLPSLVIQEGAGVKSPEPWEKPISEMRRDEYCRMLTSTHDHLPRYSTEQGSLLHFD